MMRICMRIYPKEDKTATPIELNQTARLIVYQNIWPYFQGFPVGSAKGLKEKYLQYRVQCLYNDRRVPKFILKYVTRVMKKEPQDLRLQVVAKYYSSNKTATHNLFVQHLSSLPFSQRQFHLD